MCVLMIMHALAIMQSSNSIQHILVLTITTHHHHNPPPNTTLLLFQHQHVGHPLGGKLCCSCKAPHAAANHNCIVYDISGGLVPATLCCGGGGWARSGCAGGWATMCMAPGCAWHPDACLAWMLGCLKSCIRFAVTLACVERWPCGEAVLHLDKQRHVPAFGANGWLINVLRIVRCIAVLIDNT